MKYTRLWRRRHTKSQKKDSVPHVRKNIVGKIQVGRTKIKKEGYNRDYICKYSDVPTDPSGFVWDLCFYPIDFDMMYVKVKDSTKITPAWWDGRHWRGPRLDPKAEVAAWKRNFDY